jgi:hypothetical protein
MIAAFRDLSHRSELSAVEAKRLSPRERDIVATVGRRVWNLVRETRDARARDCYAFVQADLCGGRYPSLVQWLSPDLLDIFDASVKGQLCGVRQPVYVPVSPTATIPMRTRAPKGGGASVERDALWFCQARLAKPPIPVHELATTDRDTGDRHLKARHVNTKTGKQYADTSNVDQGIARAEHLLTLPIPVEERLRRT